MEANQPIARLPYQDYSLRKNLRLMAQLFYKPGDTIVVFLHEISPLFALVPFATITLTYAGLALLPFLTGLPQPPAVSPLPKLLPLAERGYRLFQGIFGPLLGVIDVLLLAGVFWLLVRLLGWRTVSVRRATLFFLFSGSTISLLALVADVLFMIHPTPVFIYVHPLCGLIDIVLLDEFIHRQANLSHWKALALVLPALVVFFSFRIPFFR